MATNARTRSALPRSTMRRPTPGFSMIELMIVAAMTSFLLLMISGIWAAFGRALSDTAMQTRVLCEADIAVESLRRDLSGHLPSTTAGAMEDGRFVGRLVLAGGSQLMLCFDGPPVNGVADWASPDTVVSYEVQDGQLLRIDQQSGSAFVVSDGVEQFAVVDQADGVTIDLTIRRRDQSRTYTLEAQDP